MDSGNLKVVSLLRVMRPAGQGSGSGCGSKGGDGKSGCGSSAGQGDLSPTVWEKVK